MSKEKKVDTFWISWWLFAIFLEITIGSLSIAHELNNIAGKIHG